MSEAQDIVNNLQERLNDLFTGYKFEIRRLFPAGPADGVAIDFYRVESNATPEALLEAPAFLRVAIDALEPVVAKWPLDGIAPQLKIHSVKSKEIRFPSKAGTPLEVLRHAIGWYEHHAGYLKSGIAPAKAMKVAAKPREEPSGPRRSSGPRKVARRGGGGGGGGKVFNPFKKKKGMFEW